MAAVSDAAVADLASRFSGELVRPGDPTYDEVRKIFNGMIDRRPALIARARSAQDVAETIRFATKEGFTLAVRGGGHAIAGFSMIDDAVVSDLSLMNDVRVDPDASTILAGPGCRWKDVDTAAGAYGLATPGGTISSTGIAGFTLGGGIGFLAKKYGLACDNLLEAEVALANGDIVRTSERDNPELFWAIRGGGGNFGVVTSFMYRAYNVPEVTFGIFMWPAAQGAEILRFYRDYFPDTPPEVVGLAMMGTAPPLPFVPEEIQGTEVVIIGAIVIGSGEEAEPWMKPILDRSPVAQAVIPMPYMYAQQLLDATAPEGVRNYWRSSFMDSVPDEALSIIAEEGAKNPSPMSVVQLINTGPAPEVDNAFPGRDHPFLYHLISVWLDPAEDERQIAWNTALSTKLAPYSAQSAYLNFIGDEGSDRVRRAYGAKYERLVELKRTFDPDNVFRNNQNIAP
ncbi:MAG: FAD-binding oxidoreductase [Actinomycetota bacterium]